MSEQLFWSPRNNYEKPTPIQAQAMPVIMSGRDMIGKGTITN